MPENSQSTREDSPFDLNGQTIWVMGGAGYLGSATVHLLCQQGARVICADLADKAFVFQKQSGLGEQLIPVAFDLADTKNIATVVEELEAHHGVRDGSTRSGPIQEAHASQSGKVRCSQGSYHSALQVPGDAVW